jgi:hypothetical protein
MILELHDLHAQFNAAAERLQVYAAGGQEVFAAAARNRTVNPGEGHWGHIPPGEFKLGVPVPKNAIPFGKWFIPVLDYLGQDQMQDFQRSGIGIHGGGSGLPDPFAPRQGNVITEGCIRLQNEDLQHLVHRVNAAQQAGGVVYLTVTGVDT